MKLLNSILGFTITNKNI